MDNPQHYQPLSHALHPPLVRQSRYSTFNASGQPYPANGTQREEEEEEEGDIVEEELDEQNHDASTPENRATTGCVKTVTQSLLLQNTHLLTLFPPKARPLRTSTRPTTLGRLKQAPLIRSLEPIPMTPILPKTSVVRVVPRVLAIGSLANPAANPNTPSTTILPRQPAHPPSPA